MVNIINPLIVCDIYKDKEKIEPIVDDFRNLFKYLYGDFKDFIVTIHKYDRFKGYSIVNTEYHKKMGTTISESFKNYNECSYKIITRSIIKHNDILRLFLLSNGTSVKYCNSYDEIVAVFNDLGYELKVTENKEYTEIKIKKKRGIKNEKK